MHAGSIRRGMVAAIVVLLAAPLWAADWPTWRGDASRSAASTESLPDELFLLWRRDCGANHVAWQEDPRLQFDAGYEPVVLGGTMFVASARTESVTALDTATGTEKWRFYAEGPIRLAPIAWHGKIYFGADDGYFYCLDADRGTLVWKFRVAPNDRTAIGNERLISVWPVRGGPVLIDGKIYFTAGIWPFEGTLLYTLDAAASGDGPPQYKADALEQFAPQGHLAASGKYLFIPCGRGKSASIDRTSGEPVGLNYDSRGRTDHHVSAAGSVVFHGGKAYDLAAGRLLPIDADRPVTIDSWVYAGGGEAVVAYDLARRETFTEKDRRGQTVTKERLPMAWRLPVEAIAAFAADPVRIHIKAGNRLYGHRAGTIFALDLSPSGAAPEVSWSTAIDGTPWSMLAADDKLFVVTREGRIYAFGVDNVEPKMYPVETQPRVTVNDQWTTKAAEILKRAEVRDGYCLVPGIGSGRLIDEILRQSQLEIVAIDSSAEKIDALRRRMTAQGDYGSRIVARTGDPLDYRLPPYFANLIASEEPPAADQKLIELCNALRPYGGAACLEIAETIRAKETPPGVEVRSQGPFMLLVRSGALPGAADWTHEYADPSNTIMSHDQLVRAPLGVLWFGGPASHGELFFDRHEWGPSLTIVQGRMFIQGPRRLTAVDIYTGRVLWQIPLRDGQGVDRRGNFFEDRRPGFHYVAAPDGVYLVYPDVCVRVDPVSGRTLARFKLPGADAQWGRVRIWKDRLIATVFRPVEKRGLLPVEIVAIDRHDGRLLWSTKAAYSCPLVAVGGDKVFFFDGIIAGLYDSWKRKGLVPEGEPNRFLKALDVETGKQRWEQRTGRLVTWLAYSEEHDVLVATNKKGIDAVAGGDGAGLWNKDQEGHGFLGHPEELWDKVILWRDRIIDQRGPGLAYQLRTGEPVMHAHPITGEPVPWQFTKTGHHCNYAVASPHLLTFRAEVAGFLDLETCGTSRLSGFRSGCRNSLIPAGGVLNAPNYAHGCVCGYDIFTSLALVHVPEADLWTYSAYKPPEQRIQRAGINFGAPGDRLAPDGTLWMDYPSGSGPRLGSRGAEPSPDIAVELAGDSPRWFRLHSDQITGEGLRWVAASGVEGLSDLVIKLPGSAGKKRNHTLRLYFTEPDRLPPGQRVFSISIQDQPVLEDLDIAQESGGPGRLLIKEFHAIPAADILKVAFSPRSGRPLICGLEIVAEPEP